MRCHICDVSLAEPVFNRDHNQWEPCEECLSVIRDTVAQFHDRPSAEEDELGCDLPPEITISYIESILLDNSY